MIPFIAMLLVVVVCAVFGVRDLRRRRYVRAAAWIVVGLVALAVPVLNVRVHIELPPPKLP
jgi:hypothetical protein